MVGLKARLPVVMISAKLQKNNDLKREERFSDTGNRTPSYRDGK